MEKISVKKNLFFSMAYQILNIILPLITAPYTARVLGLDGVGTNAYYASIASYFLVFIMLGLNNYGNRTIAQSRDDPDQLSRQFWGIYTMQFLCGIVVLGIYFAFCFAIGQGDQRIYLLINGITVLSGLFDINWFFFGCERFQLTVSRNFIIRLLSIALIFTFVHQPEHLLRYMGIMVGSTLLSQLALWPYLFRMVTFTRPRAADVWQHFKPNLILFIPVVAISIYTIMDKIMLGYLSSKGQTGLYEYAEKIIKIPTAVIGAVGAVMMPRVAHLLSHGDTDRSLKYFRDTMQVMMMVALALAFGLVGIAHNTALVLFGTEFQECGTVIAMLAVTIPPLSWANVIRTQYLIPLKKDRSYIVSVIAGAVVNACLNVYCIPRWGARGAAIGTICAEYTVMLLQTIAVIQHLPIVTCLKDTVLPFLSAGIMLVAVRLVGRLMPAGIAALAAQIIIGAVVYLTILAGSSLLLQPQRSRYLVSLILPQQKRKDA